MSPQLDNRRPRGILDRLIGAIASKQHGVIALWQLLSLGLSSRAVRDRVASGRLHRIHRGVYAVGRPDVTIKGKWTAAVLACGEGALLSHQSAATLHGLLNARGGRIHVTVPRRTSLERRRGHPGVTRLRAALEVDGMGFDRTKSKLEKRCASLAGRSSAAPTGMSTAIRITCSP